MLVESLAEDGLAAVGHALQADHQIEVEAAHDHDASSHMADNVRGRASRAMTTLGIDLGTGSVKAAVLDDDLRVLAKAGRPNRVDAPQPGWAESDPQQWLDATPRGNRRGCC